MSIDQLFSIPCTLNLHAPGTPDEYGDVATVETQRSSFCELQQYRRDEDTVNADTQLTAWTIFLRSSDADITGSDSVTIDGITYEMVGDPQPMRNPRTRKLSHVECTATRTR